MFSVAVLSTVDMEPSLMRLCVVQQPAVCSTCCCNARNHSNSIEAFPPDQQWHNTWIGLIYASKPRELLCFEQR